MNIKDILNKFKLDKFLKILKKAKFDKEKLTSLRNISKNLKLKERFQLILDRIKKIDLKEIFMWFISSCKEKYLEAKHYLQNIQKDFNKRPMKYVRLGLICGLSILYIVVGILYHRPGKNNDALVRYIITDNQAEEYFYDEKYNQAIEEYEKIKTNTDKPLSYWDAKISEVYSVEGDLENSRKYLTKAKEEETKDADSFNYIVFTEFMNKDYDVALKDGEEALKLAPKNKSLIKTMFTVYMANNELDKAKQLISDYPLNESSAYETAEYARMLMIVGEWDEGYNKLHKAWDIDKDEYKIYDVLSQIALYNRDFLLENIANLSTQNPSDIAYKMWLAKIYSLDESTSDQANSILDSIKSEDVGKIEIKLIEASILQNLNQNSKADGIIEKLINEKGDDYRIAHAAGWYYLNKKDYDKAEKYCRESIVKNKNYPDNYGFLMPEILRASGKTLAGEPYFRTALLREPYNYNIMLNIANFYLYTAKNSDKALEYFKFAEIIQPSEPEIKYNMALIYINNGKNDEAINTLKECIKLSDSIPKYHRTLGYIYMTQKKNEDAIKEIRYAYSADMADIVTLNDAGCYYMTVEADSNLERALFNLQKAVEGINDTTDKYTADVIKANYEKAKKVSDQLKTGKSNQVIKIPEFTLLY